MLLEIVCLRYTITSFIKINATIFAYERCIKQWGSYLQV